MSSISSFKTLTKILITERVITFATRALDIMMLGIIAHGEGSLSSIFYCILLVTPAYLFFCSCIIIINDACLRHGYDLTGIEELRSLSQRKFAKRSWRGRVIVYGLGKYKHSTALVLKVLFYRVFCRTQIIQRFISWFMRSRKTIFWIGSWFYLDPDYVTLLLRDRRKSFLSDLFRITLPSVCISMFVWTPIWWGAYRGYEWAKWLML